KAELLGSAGDNAGTEKTARPSADDGAPETPEPNLGERGTFFAENGEAPGAAEQEAAEPPAHADDELEKISGLDSRQSKLPLVVVGLIAASAIGFGVRFWMRQTKPTTLPRAPAGLATATPESPAPPPPPPPVTAEPTAQEELP